MKIKKILLLFTITLIYISCANREIRLVEGNWILCSIYTNGSKISFNVCPDIIFFKNKTGKTIDANNKEKMFEYKIDKEIIIINYSEEKNSKEKDFILPHAIYFYRILQKNEYYEMIIEEPNSKRQFILRKVL